jgi:hypothetical protein
MFIHSLLRNPAIKFLFLVGFFIFFYIVIFKIGVFFGIDEVELLMYMGWVGLLMILLTFLPYSYSLINIVTDPTINAVPVSAIPGPMSGSMPAPVPIPVNEVGPGPPVN